MNKPDKLYKYQTLNTVTLENLSNNQLFMSRPNKFNDPFDCRMPAKCNLSDEDYELLFRSFSSSEGNSNEIDTTFLTNGKINDNFKIAMKAEIEQSTKNMSLTHGVACFSAKKDDILMWAYYADGHKGLCLEFDTKKAPFSNPFKVNYERELPNVNWREILLNNSFSEYIKQVTIKYKDWEHEEEWRIFNKDGDVFIKYDPFCLTAVYFGAEMPKTHIEIVTAIVKNHNTLLYRMEKDAINFAINPKLIT
jgi:hypothetical protein